MSHVVVLGAGPMGLAAAHRAARLGHRVTVLEAMNQAGGMAAHFDFSGLSIERFYHFVCRSDVPTFELMEELGIKAKLKWAATTMGYRTHGKVYGWGDPVSLLRFPHLTLGEKPRMGLHMLKTVRAKDFDAIEPMTARDWIERESGKSVYDKMWRRLQELKFHEYADEVSASWIATRIRRIGRSRKSLFQEQLGYIEGGSEALVEAIAAAIRRLGGEIRLSTRADAILSENGQVTGVRARSEVLAADAVISTVPTPLVGGLVPDLPPDWKAKYAAIRSIGVVCVVFKLRKRVTRHFWLNIIEPDIEAPGFIEYSNLRPLPHAVVYVPYYMPVTLPKWGMSDKAFAEEAFGYVKRVNPSITDADRLDTHVGRLRHAQPICEPDFYNKIPPVQTPIAGLQVADTCFYYPEDRGIAESIRLGRRMAEAVRPVFPAPASAGRVRDDAV